MNNFSDQKVPVKQEVDTIFRVKRAQWEAEADKFFPPGYVIQHGKHKGSLQIIGLDPATGFGFSIQPVYENDTDPPLKVIIGNYFPAGQLLGLTDASESDMIQKAENDLEGAYTVKVGQLSDMKDSEGIEFVIRKKV